LAAKLQKNVEMQKENVFFFCISGVYHKFSNR